METETFAALTASGRSPERRRSQAEVLRSGLTEPTTTVLRGRKQRTGSSEMYTGIGISGKTALGAKKTDGVNNWAVEVRREDFGSPQ